MTKPTSDKIRDPKKGLIRLADLTKCLLSVPKSEYEKREETWKRNKDNRIKQRTI